MNPAKQRWKGSKTDMLTGAMRTCQTDFPPLDIHKEVQKAKIWLCHGVKYFPIVHSDRENLFKKYPLLAAPEDL